jgi:dolichol-phosphate mannosyltransferase
MTKDYSDLTVIIPTLNEVDNIGGLIRRLTSGYKNVSVIVSDDGSTDGTKEVVLACSRRNRTHGLTASVLDAAMQTRTGKIVVMDGDLQHPPQKVRKIADLLDDCDLCVGVRTTVKNWGLHRRIISKGYAYFSVVVFKLRDKPVCNDMMSGFFGVKTTLFKRLIREHRDRFVEDGLKILLDVLKLLDSNVRMHEVPYVTFHERKEGKSKFSFKHVVSTLKSTFR